MKRIILFNFLIFLACVNFKMFAQDQQSSAHSPSPLSTEEFSEEDVVFFVGEGEQTAYVMVDFRDGTADASFTWGIRYSEEEQPNVIYALDLIQEEDAHFYYEETGGFLNDIIYNHHEGLDSMPDWWSTWSGTAADNMEMNAGISSSLNDGMWYGFSYGFMPEPQMPQFVYAAYNSEWLDFEDVESWFGEGENQTIITIDFVNDENEEEVTFAWGLKFEEETISALIALETIADLDENLQIVFDDADQIESITYQEMARTSNAEENWKAFIGNNMSDYAPAENGLLEEIKNNKIFGLSFGGEKVRRPYIPVLVENTDMGIDQVEKDVQVKVWPNPTTDILQITSTSEIQKIQVFDLQGRKVLEGFEKELNVENLLPGNYLLRIIGDQMILNKRFIKK